MTRSPERRAPACYAIRVDGRLDDHWSAWFGDLTVTDERDGTTSLSGPVADQAELHGLLMKVRDLGVTLLSVAVIDPSDSADHKPEPRVTGSGRGAHPAAVRQQVLAGEAGQRAHGDLRAWRGSPTFAPRGSSTPRPAEARARTIQKAASRAVAAFLRNHSLSHNAT